MKEEDIPVLTDILSSDKSQSKGIPLSPALLAEIVERIRPQLELDIEKNVTQKLKGKIREEILTGLHSESANVQKANQAYLASALSQLYEQQEQRFEKRFEDLQGEKEDALRDFVNNENC